MKKKIFGIISIIIVLIFCFIYYYITLPAINIHSPGIWLFAISLIAIFITLYCLIKLKKINKTFLKFCIGILISSVLIFTAGSLLSSPIFNSKKYQQLITVNERNFSEDIKEISYDSIPILDKDTAEQLGLRKMGSMADMVSQFTVSNLYTQINYKEKPTRVSPLEYASKIKWLTNRKKGIPAYMLIDMTTQNIESIKLENGIKYSFSEPLNRNVNRYLRFHYPTYIFDKINFEIDDNGIPYWICPVRDYTIGLFGGIKIKKVILLNAVTGELSEYEVSEVPKWVDKVYSAELLISYYDYYGSLKHGYLNSIMGQKDCLKTTDGYNYIALEDDVWVYTGVTSVSSDSSNIGFVLMNQRTMETRFYSISGAEEFSAMASAEGQVQNLGYKATFPLLLNISGEPTYFIALKDNAGLVKAYAMVNIEKYQIVAIGNSVNECEKAYINLLKDNGLSVNKISENTTAEGTINKIKELIVNGNTHYIIWLNEFNKPFDINAADNYEILNYELNEKIKFSYTESEDINIAESILK